MKKNYKEFFKLVDKNAGVRSLLFSKGIEYCDSIKAALSLDRMDDVKNICDEECQFLCDASREFLKLAGDAEKLAEEYPDCRPILYNIARDMRGCSQVFIGCYKTLENFQKKGFIPTNMLDLSDLLDNTSNNKP